MKTDLGPLVRRIAALDTRAPVTLVDGPPVVVEADPDQLEQLGRTAVLGFDRGHRRSGVGSVHLHTAGAASAAGAGPRARSFAAPVPRGDRRQRALDQPLGFLLALVSLPGEQFVDFALQVRAGSPIQTWPSRKCSAFQIGARDFVSSMA